MGASRGRGLLERRLRAEIRRVMVLLERARLTRLQVRVLVALKTGKPYRKPGIRSRRLKP